MKKILLSIVALVAFAFNANAENYTIDFTISQGEWTINDVVKPENLNYVWAQSSSYGMKASAYVNKVNYATESWLISPAIELVKTADAEAITLVYSQTGKFFSDMENEAVVCISTDKANWTTLTPDQYMTGNDWTFVDSKIDLTSYAGQTVYIGFKYTSSDTAAATWEIKKVTLEGTDVEKPQVETTGDGTQEKPYTADDIKALYEANVIPTEKVWVSGKVIGTLESVNSAPAIAEENVATNLALGTEDSWIPVELKSGSKARTDLNLIDHPEIAGATIAVYGNLQKYFNVAGIKAVTDYTVDESTTDIKNVAVDANAPVYNLAGQRVADNYRGVVIMNGKKVIK